MDNRIGIRFERTKNSKIENNIIFGNTTEGVRFVDSPGNKVSNNTEEAASDWDPDSRLLPFDVR